MAMLCQMPGALKEKCAKARQSSMYFSGCGLRSAEPARMPEFARAVGQLAMLLAINAPYLRNETGTKI